MLITIAETVQFRRKILSLLSDSERDELINYLAADPACGVLMKDTGGIRKLRWSRAGMSKSGAVRVIYYFHSDAMPLYLLTVFAKNEKANLSRQERNDLAKAARDLVATWRYRNGQRIH